MTTENHPTIREPIIRDTMLREDPVAVEADASPILTEKGNPVLDEKGRVTYDD